MHAERAPFFGIVIALVIVAAETIGLLAYARASEPPAAASVGTAQTSDTPLVMKRRHCHYH